MQNTGMQVLKIFHQSIFGHNKEAGIISAADVWKKLSKRYAKGSSGNVYGFVEGSWEGSIFNTVEYPALKSNPNIENIFTELFKNGGN